MGRRRPDFLEVAAVLLGIVLIGAAVRYMTRPSDVGPLPADARDTQSRMPAPGNPDAFRLDYFDPENGKPVRFNPCVPLHYVVNPSGMPEGALPIVQEGIKEMSAAAGIEMVFDGPTDEPPPPFLGSTDGETTGLAVRPTTDPKRYGRDQWSPVLFAWKELPRKADGRAPFGTSGALAVRAPEGPAVLVTGVIVVAPDGPTRKQLKSTVMHEFGHMLGLTHVTDTQQLMNPSVVRYRLGAGDLNGLKRVGREAGCLPAVSPPAPGVELQRAK